MAKLTPDAVAQAPDVTPADVVDEEALLQELAALSLLDYDRRRESAAKLLGVRVATLDTEVTKRRPQDAQAEGQGTSVVFADVPPCPDPVDGAALLDHLTQVFTDYLILPTGGAEALALWTLHAYTYEAYTITPRLGITSPQKRCGKTRVLEALSLLAPRALLSSNATPAAIFRAIELWKPTLLIDEADTVLPGNEELRGILNSGHTRRSAFVLRTVGDDHEPRQFSTWAPLAIAMIGALPGTLADRSIVLSMRRKKADEQVKRLPLDDQAQPFADLRRQCVRWARDNCDSLREATPTVPPGLHDRAADNWRPLCALAAVVGEEWPARLHKAIGALVAQAPEDEETSILLLKDLQMVFRDQKTDRIFSEHLAKTLHELEDKPWPEYGRQRKPISPNQIARLLKPFEIRPKQMRIGKEDGRGYQLEDCQDAFIRYISPSQTATPQHSSNNVAFRENQTATTAENVAVWKSQNPASHLTCSGVALQEGGREGEGSVNVLPLVPKGAMPPPYSAPPHGRPFTVGQHIWLYQTNGRPLVLTPTKVLEIRNIDGQVDLRWRPSPDEALRWHNAAYAMPAGEVPS
jgi:putative DNA primase/helicase